MRINVCANPDRDWFVCAPHGWFWWHMGIGCPWFGVWLSRNPKW